MPVLHTIGHVCLHALLDTLKVIPFLFLTYLFLEWFEHKAATLGIVEKWFKRSKHIAPACGGLLGTVPQCGFSAMASSLYVNRVISLGALFSVLIATSDEMLPLLVAGEVGAGKICLIVGIKLALALAVGYGVDLCFKPKEHTPTIHESCQKEHCHCEEGIWRSALHHTLQITLFIFVANVVLGGMIEWIGEERLAGFAQSQGILSYLAATLIGLIPKCASSVILTELYTGGIIKMGMLLSGMIPCVGIGSIVLLRQNSSKKQSFLILGALALLGLVFGYLVDLLL